MFAIALIALAAAAALVIAFSLSSSSTEESSAESPLEVAPEGTAVERAETPETRGAPPRRTGNPTMRRSR